MIVFCKLIKTENPLLTTIKMDTRNMNNALFNIKSYKGTFPCDMLPPKFSLPACFVVNTDVSTQPGEHWVAILISKNRHAEYFDSYGLPPINKHIVEFLHKNSSSITYNTVTLQDLNSSACGYYCILFLEFRAKNISYYEIINIFSKNTKSNDKIAVKIAGKMI